MATGGRKWEPIAMEIGTLYDPKCTTFPEGVLMHISAKGITVQQCVNAPTKEELTMFECEPFAMRLLVGRLTLMFLFRFGNHAWQEGPFSIHRVAESERQSPPDPGEGNGWLV